MMDIKKIYKDKEFMAYKHDKFWYCIDNRRDHKITQDLYKKGNSQRINVK